MSTKSKSISKSEYAKRGDLYCKKFERLAWLDGMVPYKRRQLKKLKAMHAPKDIIDSTAWLIKKWNKERRHLQKWAARPCDRNWCKSMFYSMLADVARAMPKTQNA